MTVTVIASTVKPKAPKIAVDERGYVYPLTTCCDATGKGLMDEESFDGYVGCRKCYREVSDLYGTGWDWDDEEQSGWSLYLWLATDYEGLSPEDAKRAYDELKSKAVDVIAARDE